MEKSFGNDSRRLSRLSTAPLTTSAHQTPEKRSRFRRRVQYVDHQLTQPNSQLPEVYANCIKMVNDNKINTHNAFVLDDLTGYMAEMVHNDDSGITNFQAVSCTLDASAKIYAHRVDHVHAETFKIAGNLGRNEKEPSADADKSQHDSNTDAEPGKKKKTGKKTSRIQAKLETITIARINEATDVDPLSKQMTDIYSEGYGGRYMMTVVAPYDDSGQLMFDYNMRYYRDKNALKESERSRVDVTPLRDMVNAGFLDAIICPEFDDYRLGDANVTEMDFDATNGHARFDDPVDVNEDNTAFQDNAAEAADVEFCNDAPEQDPNSQDTFAGVAYNEFMETVTSAPTEYSCIMPSFLTTWAGPNHWKIRSAPKDKEDAPKTVTRRKAGCQKQLGEINFAQDPIQDEKFADVKSQLSVRMLNAWNKLKTTLPADYRYDIKEFSAYYLAPQIMKNRTANVGNGKASSHADFPASNYHSDNSGIGEDFADHTDNGDTQTVVSMNGETEAAQIFSGDNLIKAPQMVPKSDLNYNKVVKKVNFRRLKHSMWKLITRKEKAGPNETMQSELETADDFDSVVFSQLYRELPSYLPSKMLENISIPITISCLLHLANEMNLKLVSENGLDIIIRKD